MKLNIFKSTFFFALVTIMLTSCDDKGYWDPYEMEGEQYSFITTSVNRNYKRATSSAGKNPYFVYTLRRSTNEGDASVDIKVSGEEKTIGYFSCVPAEGEEGTPLNTADYVPVVKFVDGSYEAQFILEYTKGYSRPFGSTKLTISFNKELKSPGGYDSATASVAVSAKGTD